MKTFKTTSIVLLRKDINFHKTRQFHCHFRNTVLYPGIFHNVVEREKSQTHTCMHTYICMYVRTHTRLNFYKNLTRKIAARYLEERKKKKRKSKIRRVKRRL